MSVGPFDPNNNGKLPPSQRQTKEEEQTKKDDKDEGWKPYKKGIEINNKGQFRTVGSDYMSR